MKQKTRIAGVALCLCGCFLLTACGIAVKPQDSDTAKYNAYMEFLNFTSGQWFEAMYNSYFNKFGTEKTLTVPEVIDGFDSQDTADTYEQSRKRADLPKQYSAEQPVYEGTDEKAAALCGAYEALVLTLFRDVGQYYTNREYETDNFERGRELHTRMLKDYSAFLTARYDFATAFDVQIKEKEQEGLNELKEKGRLIHYYSIKLIIDSREISDMFDELDAEGIDFLAADLDKYTVLYNQFIADLKDMKSAAAKVGQLRKEGYTGFRQTSFNNFCSLADGMEIAATDTRNMIETGKGDAEDEQPESYSVTGGRNYPMNRFNSRLNKLIDYYNKSIT